MLAHVCRDFILEAEGWRRPRNRSVTAGVTLSPTRRLKAGPLQCASRLLFIVVVQAFSRIASGSRDLDRRGLACRRQQHDGLRQRRAMDAEAGARKLSDRRVSTGPGAVNAIQESEGAFVSLENCAPTIKVGPSSETILGIVPILERFFANDAGRLGDHDGVVGDVSGNYAVGSNANAITDSNPSD